MKKMGAAQGTVIKICTCKHIFQDKRYGVGKRVHNVAAGKSSHDSRCSVCGTTK